ncbi:MAG: tetratricopeptide repeat protein [Pirellulales bacterium]
MKPPSNEVDQFGFPIPPNFEGERTRTAGARRVGRLVWRWGLVLVFVALLLSSALRSGMIDYGKAAMAEGLLDRAQRKLQIDDVEGALADLNRAASWKPDDKSIRYLRARVRLEANDVEGSLDDYNKLMQMAPHFTEGYLGRSMALQRLDRHHEAIADLSRAVADRPDDPIRLNARAYARAIAGIELEEAMQDIEKALELLGNELGDLRGLDDTRAHFLDTRGYLHYLRGNYEPALDDLKEAIAIQESFKHRVLNSPRVRTADPRMLSRYRRSCDQALAVMYHHRGQVYQKQGDAEAAKADLELGDKLGYNPAEGVY